MAKYVGKRIVPKHEGVWDKSRSYEPLMIVLAPNGDSYTSCRDVPAGTELSNEDYWALSGQFNAQLKNTYDRMNEDFEKKHEEIRVDLAEEKAAVEANVRRMEQGLSATESRVTAQVNAAREDLTRQIGEASSQLDAESVHLAEAEKTLNARMDSIVGSKTGDIEILDARVGYDGEAYESLGAAIRSIYPKADVRLKELEKHQIVSDIAGELKELHVVNTDNGNEQDFVRSRCTDYIAIDPLFETILYTGRVFNWIGICGYDRNKRFICSILDSRDTEMPRDYRNEVLVIPENVCYIRASSYEEPLSLCRLADMVQMEQAVKQHGQLLDTYDFDIQALHSADAYLTQEALNLLEQNLKYSGADVDDVWNANSPILSEYYVPITVVKSGYFVSLDFAMVATGAADLKVTLEFEKRTVITNQYQLVNGKNTIHFEMERHLEKGAYKLRLRASEQVMNYPFTDTKKYGFRTREYISNQASGDVAYSHDNDGLVFKGIATVRRGGTDKELRLPGIPADAAAVGGMMSRKLDIRPSSNLLDPAKYRTGWFAFKGSVKVTFHADNLRYGTTDYIPVSKNGLVTKGSGTNGVTSQVVYDASYFPIRYVDANDQYTYEEGDAYVVFCYMSATAERIAVVEGTEYSYEPYAEYLPLAKLEKHLDETERVLSEENKELGKRVEVLETSLKKELQDLTLSEISPIYTVCNHLDVKRNYHTSIWLDHLIPDATWKNQPVGFGPQMEVSFDLYSPITSGNVYNNGADILEKNVTQKVCSPVFREQNVNVRHRSTLVSAGKEKMAKVLVIGDSVTDAYLSTANQSDSTLPGPYWAWVRYLFERDRMDAGNPADAYLCRMLGAGSANGKRYGSTAAFQIGGTQYKAYAMGKGGWSAEDLHLEYFESQNNRNPFYDSKTGRFSLKACIDKLATLADDGVTRLEVGVTAGTEVVNAEAWDMCVPTHVVINLNHNSSLTEYQNNIPEVVETIKREYPDVVVVLMSIDETGTYNPALYPEYRAEEITIGGLHAKNVSIYEYIRENLEDESRGIYVCSGHLVQPAVESYPTLEYQAADSIGSDRAHTRKIAYAKGSFGGPNWHPNNLAHAAWGYQLYALIKYTLAKDAAKQNG